MSNYNFLVLSSYEFELLSRDLLQKFWNIYLESFGHGADQGIDLRHSSGENIIVQCKRYKDFSPLFSNLKEEVEKVQKLSPQRYVVTTSVSLNPNQKEQIKNLFAPYIKSTEDIFGKEDLNNLLTQYSDILRNYYKLWLSSTQILHEIINSQIKNQSRFVHSEIIDKIKVYVQNKSFNESLKILNKNKYLIISGMPGIGKTTLAEMLVFHLLGNGYNEFIFLADTINEGFQLFEEGKKQIFLFDDFLGRNFLTQTSATNEERQIIRFIKLIQKSEHKILIFTTREYILNQAKQEFESFDNVNFSKCILDLSKYTKLVKAQILYNHLFINEVPFRFIDQIIKQNCLFQIINHKNYNPRIIEAFTHSRFWDNCETNEFPQKVIALFNKPFLVWQHVYETQISEIARIILVCLLVVDNEIDYKRLFKQVKLYSSNNKDSMECSLNYLSFKAAIKELDNSLIKIKKNPSNENIISYQNPSVQDFLVNYINEDELSRELLLNSIMYANPALGIISKKSSQEEENRIIISNQEWDTLGDYLIKNLHSLKYDYTLNPLWSTTIDENAPILDILNLIRINFGIKKYYNFIREEFQKHIYSENIARHSLSAYTTLLNIFEDDFKYDVNQILLNTYESIFSFDDLAYLYEIKLLDIEAFDNFSITHNDKYCEIFHYIVDSILDEDDSDPELLTSNINKLEEIQLDFDFDTSYERDQLQEKLDNLERLYREHEENSGYDEYDYWASKMSYKANINNYSNSASSQNESNKQISKSEDEIIIDIFKSLK